jgi:AbrB family looped-hinge helix DNA binding protein
MKTYHAKVGAGGRVILPAALRHQLGIGEGDTLVLDVGEGDVRVTTLNRAIDEAQAYFAQFSDEETNEVDALMQQRREEAARE